MILFGYIASLFIGISLGLIGGGGSILAMPILVYLFDIPASQATTYSLFIVGISALIGAFKQYQQGQLSLKTAFVFAIPSILTLTLVRKFLLPQIPDIIASTSWFQLSKNGLLMGVFAILMLASSYTMIKKTTTQEKVTVNQFRLLVIGALVGILIGFLGAGGGFMIIPALLFFGGLTIRQAIGTSLFIIFLNSSIGFSGDILNRVEIDYFFIAKIGIISILGMLIGSWLSSKLDSKKLKPLFGWVVLVMGIYILVKELLLH